MALVHRVIIYLNLDDRGKPTAKNRIAASGVHFSITSATNWISSMAKMYGYRRIKWETIQVDIPGMGDDEGALDNMGPGYAKYRKQIDTVGYLRRSSPSP